MCIKIEEQCRVRLENTEKSIAVGRRKAACNLKDLLAVEHVEEPAKNLELVSQGKMITLLEKRKFV